MDGNFRLSKHKFFEWQVEFKRFHDQPFDFSLRWSTKRDHAGIDFTFSIYKLFWLNLNIYDHRHWDHDKDNWES